MENPCEGLEVEIPKDGWFENWVLDKVVRGLEDKEEILKLIKFKGCGKGQGKTPPLLWSKENHDKQN